MKPTILILAALMFASSALAQDGPANDVVAGSNSSMLVKMTTTLSTMSSKPGDPVSSEVIDPRHLRGAKVEGTVERADHSILNFSFHQLLHGDKVYPIQSRLVSITSSKGNEGRDDLNQRIRIEGAGIIAYGVATALDEGAEVRITAWSR